ncbi:amidase family protein [Fulvimarina sp. 2208YS6-2-32]|uniref:Amidase family protein n=1 Tax=Fulvimarina uroteuthidis TaxID=3098149 RepID=A0ABU5I6M9_9HYPH|nr:amidase family protein [Fulvimarina sp. 2208YS6-2-32]MDY8109791.1 amidase family protein [Fulvimarina sp. 2208YS6-2-32]
MAQIIDLPLPVLRERLAKGAARSVEVTEAVLKRIASLEEGTAQLAWLDEDYARRVAGSRDAFRGRAKALGALHGVPVLVDDAFDIARVPMTRGFAALEGALSERDSAVASSLRAAGAQLFAKSAIPALRVGEGDPGAASLVARRCFPLAVCVDADGGALRSAALSGVFGYRPSAGMVPRTGLLDIAPSLDAVTLLAGELGNVAALGDVLATFDAGDARSEPLPKPRLDDASRTPPPMAPTIGFLTDGRENANAAAGELAGLFGERAFKVPLPTLFEEVGPQGERVIKAEGAKCLKPFERRFTDALPDRIRTFITEGEAISAVDYLRALDFIPVLRAGMTEIFARCNVAAMIGPIAGEGGGVSGESLAAFLRLPAVTLPILEAPDGKPLGVTLIARDGEDARLIQTAAWLLQTLNGEDA